jgi:hypothetical protein
MLSPSAVTEVTNGSMGTNYRESASSGREGEARVRSSGTDFRDASVFQLPTTFRVAAQDAKKEVLDKGVEEASIVRV